MERQRRSFISNPNLELAGCCQMLTRWVLSRLKSRGPLVLLVFEASHHEVIVPRGFSEKPLHHPG